MSTLYRDYRPQSFSEVLGQNHIKVSLQNEIQAGKLASAYLFCGPRAVGKTTLARIVAKAVNCEKRPKDSFEPCNQCLSCKSINSGSNLDVMEIDAASNTGVDNVRENIIASARVAPQNKFKVFIIDEVHMLSISAFNALLKIIEEPPTGVLFVLCTTEIHKVPATIISRCERFDFKRISAADVVKKLKMIVSSEKIEVEDGILEAIARQANGYLRDAESLLGQVLSLGEKKISAKQAELIMPNYNSLEILDLLDHLSQRDATKALKLLNSLVDSGLNVKNFSAEIIVMLRKIIFGKINPGLSSSLGLDFGENLEAKVALISERLSLEQWIFIAQEFLNVYSGGFNSFIAQLPLELALIRICHSLDGVSFIQEESKKTLTNSPVSSSSASSSPSSPVIKKSGASLNLDRQALSEKWPELLVKIKKYNHSLSFILQNCQAKEIKDNHLCLVFKYKFHQDRLRDPQVMELVEQALIEVFGSSLEVDSSVDEALVIKTESIASGPSVVDQATNIESNDKNRPDIKKSGEEKKEVKSSDAGSLGGLLQAFGGEVIN